MVIKTTDNNNENNDNGNDNHCDFDNDKTTNNH